MSGYTYCLLSKAIAIAGFVTLVIYDSPWLGLLCFLVVASVDGEIKGSQESAK